MNDAVRVLRTATTYAVEEIERLERWKAEAMEVLAGWQEVWEAAGRPGKLGESLSAAPARHPHRNRPLRRGGRMSADTRREQLAAAMARAKDPGPVIAMAPDDDAVWDTRFDSGWGGQEGPDVNAWTADYVYFVTTYDGSEWMEAMPRNPRPEPSYAVGGG